MRKIFIQQHGAKITLVRMTSFLRKHWRKKGINTKLYTQAANSPDVNLLDLEFYRAIQSFNNAVQNNEEELIEESLCRIQKLSV